MVIVVGVLAVGLLVVGALGYAKMDKYEKETTFGMHVIRLLKATAPALIDAAKKLKKRL